MAKKITFAELGEMLTHVVKHMATKEDIELLSRQIVDLQTQTNSIETELREIKLALTRVAYRDELEQAVARIAAIERHLGLNNKIAA
jgi:chaperonin cofactor prefoldin